MLNKKESLEVRKSALEHSITVHHGRENTNSIIDRAAEFEDYLINGRVTEFSSDTEDQRKEAAEKS